MCFYCKNRICSETASSLSNGPSMLGNILVIFQKDLNITHRHIRVLGLVRPQPVVVIGHLCEVELKPRNVQNSAVGAVLFIQTINFAIQINWCLLKVGSVYGRFCVMLHRH